MGNNGNNGEQWGTMGNNGPIMGNNGGIMGYCVPSMVKAQSKMITSKIVGSLVHNGRHHAIHYKA